jgi:hypothetical protein
LTPALLLFVALTLLSLVGGSVALWWRFGRGEAAPADKGRDSDGTDFSIEGRLDKAKEDMAKVKARFIAQAAEVYRLNHDAHPADVGVLAQPDPLNQNKPYLSGDSILDPWGKRYQIDPAGPNHKGAQCDVFTTTPQGKVIGNWSR